MCGQGKAVYPCEKSWILQKWLVKEKLLFNLRLQTEVIIMNAIRSEKGRMTDSAATTQDSSQRWNEEKE